VGGLHAQKAPQASVDALEPAVPAAPQPSADSPPIGIEEARALARRYLVDSVRLFASVAFAPDSEVSLFTRFSAAKEVVAMASVPPASAPLPPPPSHELVHDGRDPN
jgi:hypothetical protein